MNDEDEYKFNMLNALDILAQKRTTYSLMRAGMTTISLPTVLVSILIPFSGGFMPFFDSHHNVALFVACTILAIMGLSTVAHSVMRIRRYNIKLEHLKQRECGIADICR